MSTTRVFRSGNSQAVRLPKQFRLESKEVEIFRRGDEIVLREKEGTMVRAFDLLICSLACRMILKWLAARRTDCRSARGCDGASLFVGHEHLHVHSSEEAG
jgi:antitoxin VapB